MRPDMVIVITTASTASADLFSFAQTHALLAAFVRCLEVRRARWVYFSDGRGCSRSTTIAN